MNAQELYLDSISGRFMDGVSVRPIENPTFYSNEKRYVKCNVLRVRGNSATPRPHAKDAGYFMRIGTATTKLADGIDPTTAPPLLITAQAVVITASPIAARGSASVITYSPVTATFTASISTISRVAADVSCKISYIPPVTALINATISTATFSTQTFQKTIRTTSIAPGPQLLGHPVVGNFYFTPSVLTFTPVFAKPFEAKYTASLNSAGGIFNITATCPGACYPDGRYYLSVESATTPTTQAVIYIDVERNEGGSSYPKIQNPGAGYTSPVTLSLFKPEAKIIGVRVSNSCNQFTTQQSTTTIFRPSFGFTTSAGTQKIDNTGTFRWALGQTSTTPAKADIIFTPPDVANTNAEATAPRAEIEFVRNEYTTGQYYGVWKINWYTDGYGYNTTPTATHNTVTVSNCKIARAYSKTIPPSGYSNITTEVRDGFTRTSQQPLIPAKITTFNSTGEEISQEEVVEINRSITGNNPGRLIPFTASKLTNTKGSIPDYASVSSKYLDTRFGATMNYSGLGIILYDFDSVGQLSQDRFENLNDKNFYAISRSSLAKAFENQLDNWTASAAQELLDRLNSVGRIENQFENRIEYLTVNADNLSSDDGRQLLAVLTTPPLNPERQISNIAQRARVSGVVEVGSKGGAGYKGRITLLEGTRQVMKEVFRPRPGTSGKVTESLGVRPVTETLAPVYFSSGGVWDTEFSIVDFGIGYSSLPAEISRLDVPGRAITDKLRGFNLLRGLETSSIFNSSMTIGITIPTGTSFKKTILSKEAETGQKLAGGAIQHFISDPGFGYTEDIVVDVVVTAPVTSGIITSVSLANTPAAYIDGTYDCAVQSPPTGTPAKIKIVFDSARRINGDLFVESSGMGYTSAPIITAPTPNLAQNGFLTSLQLNNNPSGYLFNDKEYSLTVATSPQTGGDASAKMRIFKARKITTSYAINPSADDKYKKRVYSQAELYNQFQAYNLTAIALRPSNLRPALTLATTGNGPVETFFDGDNQPDSDARVFSGKQIYYGKWKNVKVRLNLYSGRSSPVPVALYNPNNSADMTGVVRNIPVETSEVLIPTYEELAQGAIFTVYSDFIVGIEEIEFGNVYITERGFGYSTPPIITSPGPDSDDYGVVLKIFSTNSPVGYVSDYSYNLSFTSSPSAGGDALGEFVVRNGAVSASIIRPGFGYVTAPTITAQPPNAVQGYVSNIVVTSLGQGYAPGEYDCTVTTAPSGGQTAEAKFVINENRLGQFIIENSGNGYVTAPIITAATPAGSVVSGITITCQGSFYDNDDAKYSLSDSSGAGCGLGSPVISAGRIISLSVLENGYNYSNPAIVFDAPQPPVLTPLELSEVEGEFNITTASANQILGTADSRTINLEVYETDGTDQQVVARGQVNLVKRIPS